ncbi:carboxypeptidase-like regulatory domain-containing protein [Chryseobacterium carnipullorum]|uniref:TonB-linked outer membrane protein, SusC/RagA family n=1 Tax=Chryseobacterium carnipullorum TaxID=1124835 RepID=A0A376DR44_CHRCU|nr:carboxypeptidase-like regulatory domain-containing protein [Chryseobacterium carnipullorum]STC94111.1 TonB-linked outer membrane protein, SusC/RagA family [Chryseobacterium carnipullorum]
MQKLFFKTAVTAAALCFSSMALAQQKYSVSGTVKDHKNGELLIGVTVKVNEDASISVVANEYGFYSLSLPEGNYTLIVSYPGYRDYEQAIKVEQNTKVDLPLDQEDQKIGKIDEVVISGVKKNKNLTTAQMGTETLSIKNIEKLPVLFGEKDVMKTIQLLPGIKSNGEGSSGFSVRGALQTRT